MISKTLDKIQKDLDFIKEIATEENFKRLEERCDFVNTRNNELQNRIDKAIEYIEKHEEKQIAYNYEYYLEDKEVCELLKLLKGE